jgi:hypothetical protein
LPLGHSLSAPTSGRLARNRSYTDFQSAVSQNCILLSAGQIETRAAIQRPADYKSAIQQITNLRYELASDA